MAGIGFELKKFFSKPGIVNLVRGYVYASMVTIGPMIITVAALNIMYMVLDYVEVPYDQRDLLSSSALYVFTFSFISTASISVVMSRYLADCIFEERFEDILPSLHVGVCSVVVLTNLLGIPFALHEFFIGGIDALFVFATYLLFMALAMVFYLMIYVAALKEYKLISMYFFLGLLSAVLLALALSKLLGVSVIGSILYSLVIGFTMIAVFLYSHITVCFQQNSHQYKRVLKFFWKYKMMFFANLFYVLGLYVHNFVFWGSELALHVKRSFVAAPSYDMATCLAMFINLSMLVSFSIKVETNFHDKYSDYFQAVLSGTGDDLKQAGKEMHRVLSHELMFMIRIQTILVVLLFLAAMIFLPQFGLAGNVMNMLPVLSIAFTIVFVMHVMNVFLYYFDDQIGVFFTNTMFFLVTWAGSVVSRNLGSSYYGLGLFVGSFVGWSIGFFRLRYLQHNLEMHIYGRGQILNTVETERGKKLRILKKNYSVFQTEETAKGRKVPGTLKPLPSSDFRQDNQFHRLRGKRIKWDRFGIERL